MDGMNGDSKRESRGGGTATPRAGAAGPAQLALAAAAAVSVWVVASPPSATLPLAGGVVVQAWRSAAVRWMGWPATVLAVLAGWWLWRWSGPRLGRSGWGALRPVAWLPSAALAPHVLAAWDTTVAGMAFPLGGTFLAALALERWIRPWAEAPVSRKPRGLSRVWAGWAWFVGSAAALFVFWAGVAQPKGFDSGDTVHYHTMVDNLRERGDLDLTDRLEAMMAAHGVVGEEARVAWLRQSHVVANADGRMYSCHSFGFPLVARPFRALSPRWGDGVVLALLGALALCGVRAACLVHGAPRWAAETVTALTGLSYVWVFTAVSFLPEMLGIGLVAWGFWAIAAQERPGWRGVASAVAVAACGFLPVAHVRFTPTAGLLAAGFGIEGLLAAQEPFWRRKVPRLALFSLGCFAAWGWLLGAHLAMFRGTAPYDYARIAGHDPWLMWAMFADRRGVVALVPGAGALVVSALFALVRGGRAARRAAMALAVVAATLWFCCCVEGALGGECLKGRYFYPAIPVLLPFGALALARARRGGRLFLLGLFLIPVLYLAFVTPFLRGVDLLHAPETMRNLLGLSLLWEPWQLFSLDSASTLSVAGNGFAVAVLGLSVLACSRGGGRGRALVWIVLAAAAFWCGRTVDRLAPPARANPFRVFSGKPRFTAFTTLTPGSLDCFSALRNAKRAGGGTLYVLTDDAARSHEGVYRMEYANRLPRDDWAGRDLAWGRVGRQFFACGKQGGDVAFRAVGRVVRGTARLAVQVAGARDAPEIPLPGGPFDVVFRVHVPARCEGVNFRLALDGATGEAVVETAEVIPCPDGFPEAVGPFPAGAEIVDCRDGREGGRMAGHPGTAPAGREGWNGPKTGLP